MERTQRKVSRIGKVSINCGANNRLMLRYTHKGKQESLYPGLEDNKDNRILAERLAAVITNDLLTGDYDCSKLKYKPWKTEEAEKDRLTFPQLFTLYIESKNRSKGSLFRMNGNLFHLKTELNVEVGSLRKKHLAGYRRHLEKTLAPSTQREYLIQISSCLKWARGGEVCELPEVDPTEDMLRGLKVPKRSKRSLSEAEVQKLLKAFRTSRDYKFYAPYVQFLFGTGCRTCEAIALSWKDVDLENGIVHFHQSYAHGTLNDVTKNGDDRITNLSPGLVLLLSVMKKGAGNNNLVFPSKSGGYIHQCNFARRAWNQMVKASGIMDCTPYITRHTAISHALDGGAKPLDLSSQVGASLETMLKTYSHVINSQQVFKEF